MQNPFELWRQQKFRHERGFRNKYHIPLDHEILRGHGVFYPHALADELVFEITLAEAKTVVKGSGPTKLAYELTNVQLEYEALHDADLAQRSRKHLYQRQTFHARPRQPSQNNYRKKAQTR